MRDEGREKGAINGSQIRRLIETQGLVSNFIDLDAQLTPNGFDLSVEKLFALEGKGVLDFSNKQRVLPERRELQVQKITGQEPGWWELPAGVYVVRTNEVCTLPHDMIALAFTRSSLLRMGVFTEHGVWDAGFSGKAEFVLVVQNPHGIRLAQNARVAQLVFFRIDKVEEGYNGRYQNTL